MGSSIVSGLETKRINIEMHHKSGFSLYIFNFFTGQVKNVTHFGAFVDVGMETDGLIHESRLRHLPFSIQVSDRIEVRVLHVDLQRKRIQLDFIALLS